MEIKFIPKTDREIKNMLRKLPISGLVNTAGWPLANDHVVIIFDNDGEEIGRFDGRVDSTDRAWQSIPKQGYYKGMFGIHFTSSFKDVESPYAPVNSKAGNHIAISLCDSDKDFIMLERSLNFNINSLSVPLHDMRGTIGINNPQGNGAVSKFDVEIHKGNRYYASKVLSKGCPTIDHQQFDNFLATIFNTLPNNIESIRNFSCRVTIEKLPDDDIDIDDDYDSFLKLQKLLKTAKGEV